VEVFQVGCLDSKFKETWSTARVAHMGRMRRLVYMHEYFAQIGSGSASRAASTTTSRLRFARDSTSSGGISTGTGAAETTAVMHARRSAVRSLNCISD